MIAIPFQTEPGFYSVVLVLEDENIERIKRYDPGVFETSKVKVEPFVNSRLKDVCIAYATGEEIKQIQQLGNNFESIMKLLFRGLERRPDLGDHDTDSYQRVTHN